MAYNNTSIYLTRGVRYRIDGVDLPGVMNITGLGSGGATEIDTTTLVSIATEQALGLPDEGSVTLDGIAPLQDPLMDTIQAQRESGQPVLFEVIIGGVPTGERRTDGSEITVQNGVGAAAALTTGPGAVLQWTTTADATAIKPVNVGDFVQYGSVTDGKITGLSVVSEKLVITTDQTADSTENEIDIVRPAFKFSGQAFINTFEHTFNVNDVVKYNLTMRITGRLTRTTGDPDITI